MHRAAELQAKHDAAAKQLQSWVDMDPLKVHPKLLFRARENAAAVQMQEEKMEEAEAVLRKAETVQEQCDAATAKLLLAAAPRADDIDSALLKDATAAAKAARVDGRYLQIAEVRGQARG
eukprot:4087019-Prymnesium_polylepis.1